MEDVNVVFKLITSRIIFNKVVKIGHLEFIYVIIPLLDTTLLFYSNNW